jgi:hypothetical protein
LKNGLSSPQLQKSLRFFTERLALAAQRFTLYEDFRDSYNDVHCSGALQPREARNSHETAQAFQRLRIMDLNVQKAKDLASRSVPWFR